MFGLRILPSRTSSGQLGKYPEGVYIAIVVDSVFDLCAESPGMSANQPQVLADNYPPILPGRESKIEIAERREKG